MPRTPTNFVDPMALLERIARRAINDKPADLEAMYSIIIPVASWYHSIVNEWQGIETEFYRIKAWQAVNSLLSYTNKYKSSWCEHMHDMLEKRVAPRLPNKPDDRAPSVQDLAKRIRSIKSPCYSQYDADQLGKVAQAMDSYVAAFTGPTLPVATHREIYANTVRNILPYTDVPAYKRRLIFALLDRIVYACATIKTAKPPKRQFRPRAVFDPSAFDRLAEESREQWEKQCHATPSIV